MIKGLIFFENGVNNERVIHHIKEQMRGKKFIELCKA
jgi:hypothetical protein